MTCYASALVLLALRFSCFNIERYFLLNRLNSSLAIIKSPFFTDTGQFNNILPLSGDSSFVSYNLCMRIDRFSVSLSTTLAVSSGLRYAMSIGGRALLENENMVVFPLVTL